MLWEGLSGFRGKGAFQLESQRPGILGQLLKDVRGHGCGGAVERKGGRQLHSGRVEGRGKLQRLMRGARRQDFMVHSESQSALCLTKASI